jgi:hypothetical protein
MQQILFTENNDGAAQRNLAPFSFESFGNRQSYGERDLNRLPLSESSSKRPAARKFSANANAEKDKPKKLFAILLAYVDQIVYLDELSENLERLDFAIANKNTVEVCRIAAECAAVSLKCGIFATIKLLLCQLERIEHEYQLPDAASLSRQIGEASEHFRFVIKENMQQIAVSL